MTVIVRVEMFKYFEEGGRVRTCTFRYFDISIPYHIPPSPTCVKYEFRLFRSTWIPSPT